MKVKNLYDQYRAGEFTDEAQKIKEIDFRAKMKIKLNKKTFHGEIGRNGYLSDVRTQVFLPRNTYQDKAKLTDFKPIKIAGRR